MENEIENKNNTEPVVISKRKYTRKKKPIDPNAPPKQQPKQLFKPGQSGNPSGKPKGAVSQKTQIQQAFLNMLQQQVIYQGKQMSWMDAYNKTFFSSALTPGSAAFKMVADKIYSENLLDDIDRQVNKSMRENQDFQQFRVYTKAFDIQQRVLSSKAKDIGLMCGRRAGKTETNKLMSVSKALMKDNSRILIIGLTIQKTQQLYWDDTIKIIEDLGHDYQARSTESKITLYNDSYIQYGGNSNKIEREKYRGQHWDLIIIDEAQSQPELGAFVKEIINPMLLDTNGTLLMSGSGPRTRGTFWESYYLNSTPSGLRLNWNLSQNPHIHDYQNVLANEQAKHGLTDSDPLFLREYLGQIVYDDDALVFRTTDDNFYTDESLQAWIASQSPADIRFVGGLDYGFRDSDAFVVIMYSETKNEKFIVYEYKQNGTDVSTLVSAIQQGIDYIKTNQLFQPCYNKAFNIYADTSDNKITMEFSSRYGIPIFPAIKNEKTLAIQTLQEEVKKRNLKIRKGSEFDNETLRIIFKRIEIEGQPSIISKEIDDDVYHPDLMDAVLYSLRNYWLTHTPDHAVSPVAKMDEQQDIFIEQMNTQNSRRNRNLY